MKKIILLSMLFLLITILSICINHQEFVEIDGIKYAITIDGHHASTFPHGQYKVDVNCINAEGYYDNQTSKVIAKNITGSVTCNTNFVSTNNNDYLNNYIIGLNNTTQGDGKVVNEYGYRYEGKNPNNYVWFNNELWRIIGVFDSSSHGIANTNLVKIIRDESIGGLAWNKLLKNDWVNSNLKALLNGAYYNHTTDTTNCYGDSTIVPSTCDYTTDGIQSNYQGMIESVTWYLGGCGKEGYTAHTPDSVYGYERNSDAIYSGNSASTTGKIGLMYVSDYLYGVLATDCARTTALVSYDTTSCAGKNWLYGQGYEWTISQYSNSTYFVWNVIFRGYVNTGNANSGFAVRPVLYLSSSVYRVSGSGSLLDPYIIGM